MPAMLKALRKSKTHTNPLFYGDRFARLLDDPERVERAIADPESVDLLTWNIFASLETDDDRDFLAGQLRAFCGNDLEAPVRTSLWTGEHREPRIEPSDEYRAHIRADVEGDTSAFLAPIEVPVRIEGRNVLGLVDTMFATPRRGAGGRDRLVELVDAGLVQADRLGKELAVAVVYRSGTEAASEISRRVNELRQPEALRAALPWLDRVPEVRFREVTWQQLVALWEKERRNLSLFGEPVKGFLEHTRALGLR
jgi:hypothetical protein